MHKEFSLDEILSNAIDDVDSLAVLLRTNVTYRLLIPATDWLEALPNNEQACDAVRRYFKAEKLSIGEYEYYTVEVTISQPADETIIRLLKRIESGACGWCTVEDEDEDSSSPSNFSITKY